MRIYEADKVRRLCGKYNGWDDKERRNELIKIARERTDGIASIVGDDGADIDDAIIELTMAIGGPW